MRHRRNPINEGRYPVDCGSDGCALAVNGSGHAARLAACDIALGDISRNRQKFAQTAREEVAARENGRAEVLPACVQESTENVAATLYSHCFLFGNQNVWDSWRLLSPVFLAFPIVLTALLVGLDKEKSELVAALAGVAGKDDSTVASKIELGLDAPTACMESVYQLPKVAQRYAKTQDLLLANIRTNVRHVSSDRISCDGIVLDVLGEYSKIKTLVKNLLECCPCIEIARLNLRRGRAGEVNAEIDIRLLSKFLEHACANSETAKR